MRPKPRRYTIWACVDQDMHDKVTDEACYRGVARAAVIREALEERYAPTLDQVERAAVLKARRDLPNFPCFSRAAAL